MRYHLTPSLDRVELSKDLAMDLFLSVWDAHTCFDLGCALTCNEAEALCDLFAAHGKHDMADALREGHSHGDDSGDLNHNTGEEWTDEELEALPEEAFDTECIHSA